MKEERESGPGGRRVPHKPPTVNFCTHCRAVLLQCFQFFRSRSSRNLILLLFENMDVWKCFLINHLHSTFASIAVPESFLFECFESVMIIDKDCFKNWIFHKCDKIISHPYFIEITRGGFCLINVGVDPCHCWQCRVSSSCQVCLLQFFLVVNCGWTEVEKK